MRHYGSYDEMISCAEWREGLRDLNGTLLASMEGHDGATALNGNLFYEHLDPGFAEAELAPRFAQKRINLFNLAASATRMLEVGVNGGHSLYLALSANPDLQVIGVDICRQVEPGWGPVHLYVPAAFAWLERAFPGRCRFEAGNSLLILPRIAEESPNLRIDLLHLDGAKDTHLRETLAVHDLLSRDGHVIYDDANTKPVRKSLRQVRSLNLARPVDLSAMGVMRTPGHRVFRVHAGQ